MPRAPRVSSTLERKRRLTSVPTRRTFSGLSPPSSSPSSASDSFQLGVR